MATGGKEEARRRLMAALEEEDPAPAAGFRKAERPVKAERSVKVAPRNPAPVAAGHGEEPPPEIPAPRRGILAALGDKPRGLKRNKNMKLKGLYLELDVIADLEDFALLVGSDASRCANSILKEALADVSPIEEIKDLLKTLSARRKARRVK